MLTTAAFMAKYGKQIQLYNSNICFYVTDKTHMSDTFELFIY